MKIYELAKTAGALDAIRRFAGRTTNLTGEVSGIPKLLQRLFSTRRFIEPKTWPGKALYTVNELFGRGAYLGNPLNLAESIKEHGLGKTYFSHLLMQPTPTAGAKPIKPWERAVGLGFTLPFAGMDIYRAATADPEHRGEALGQATAGILAAPLTSQTGLLGQILLHDPVRRAGGWIGRKFDKPSVSPMPEAKPPYGRLTPGTAYRLPEQLPEF